MDSNLYISALQRQPCLLKTNSTRVLVTWLVTLLLIICPSSYKARLNNLIGTADIEPQIISPQWSNARPNFPTKKCVGGAKFGLVSRLVISVYFSVFGCWSAVDSCLLSPLFTQLFCCICCTSRCLNIFVRNKATLLTVYLSVFSLLKGWWLVLFVLALWNAACSSLS